MTNNLNTIRGNFRLISDSNLEFISGGNLHINGEGVDPTNPFRGFGKINDFGDFDLGELPGSMPGESSVYGPVDNGPSDNGSWSDQSWRNLTNSPEFKNALQQVFDGLKIATLTLNGGTPYENKYTGAQFDFGSDKVFIGLDKDGNLGVSVKPGF